ncbi:hypothetical protein ACFCWY_31290 [Streptomyces sp. NPDC056362]|uniref:hypothetical protein n=1 Tax=unclassified Streptomyces TaxID=2593676 RepID=UPI0035E1D097
MIQVVIRRGLGIGRAGSGGAEGRDALGDHDAAASVAAFSDRAEEGGGVGRAAAEALLQVGLETVDVTIGASFATSQVVATACETNTFSIIELQCRLRVRSPSFAVA